MRHFWLLRFSGRPGWPAARPSSLTLAGLRRHSISYQLSLSFRILRMIYIALPYLSPTFLLWASLLALLRSLFPSLVRVLFVAQASARTSIEVLLFFLRPTRVLEDPPRRCLGSVLHGGHFLVSAEEAVSVCVILLSQARSSSFRGGETDADVLSVPNISQDFLPRCSSSRCTYKSSGPWRRARSAVVINSAAAQYSAPWPSLSSAAPAHCLSLFRFFQSSASIVCSIKFSCCALSFCPLCLGTSGLFVLWLLCFPPYCVRALPPLFGSRFGGPS